MKKLTNKTAIITGGTSGMGKAAAKLFASEGASVVISGRNEMQGNEVVEEIRISGGKAIFFPGDISTYEVNKSLVKTAVNTFGGLDIIFPNAGMLGLGPITDISLDTWHQTINTIPDVLFHGFLTESKTHIQEEKTDEEVFHGLMCFYG